MLKNIFSIGGSLLFNSQAAMNIHGQNIANSSVEGYHRRSAEFSSNPYIHIGGFDFGSGVNLSNVQRHYNDFISAQQQEKNGENSKWLAMQGNLTAMNNLFKDSAEKGMTKALSDFWNQWQKLSEQPNLDAAKTSLIGKSETMINLLKSKYSDMQNQLELMNTSVGQEVSKLNESMQQLAAVNQHMMSTGKSGELLDLRDRLISKMSKIASIKTIEHENGQVTVSLKGGQTLVDGPSAFEVRFENPQTVNDQINGSSFDGTVHYKGTSNKEYTVECITDGSANGGVSAAKVRVSLDGGNTWITNPDGSIKEFEATGPSKEIKVGDISLWFGKQGDSAQATTTNLTKGDRFIVKPKKNIFWHKNSSTSEDITPQSGNDKALSGGSLAGLLRARDMHISNYAKKIDSFAKELAWQINYAHSQGASASHITNTLGAYSVEETNIPLSESALPYAAKLTRGNFSIAVYNSQTGKKEDLKPVDFSSITPPGISSFDPAVHTMENVRDAINSTYAGKATASIENGKLRVQAASGKKISFAGDSSGLLAGLGINTFISGSSASDIAVNSVIKTDIKRICAGHVNGAGEVNTGDNTVAKRIADMATKVFTFEADGETYTSTFQEFLSSLIAKVGSDTAEANSGVTMTGTQLNFLNDQEQAISGVNVKEEMIKVKKLQQNYQSAAQLIKIAGEMYDTLLTLKR
ncbi:MAG: flagellar hook-associated protein FlgK [Desulfovibrio sp.]